MLLQLKIALAVVLQWAFIWIPCMLHAWTEPYVGSIDPYPAPHVTRLEVDEWKWDFLNRWYENVEDGVSGQQALVWGSGENLGKLVPYTTLFPAWTPKWFIAYSWNLRNSANALKRPLRHDHFHANPY